MLHSFVHDASFGTVALALRKICFISFSFKGPQRCLMPHVRWLSRWMPRSRKVKDVMRLGIRPLLRPKGFAEVAPEDAPGTDTV